MVAARVESDSRNESGAKDRVDSPEQVARDLERERQSGRGRGKEGQFRPGGWSLILGRGIEGRRGATPDFWLHASSAYFKSP